MAKKHCQVGQRLDSIAADFQRRVGLEARKLARLKRPDIDTSELDKLKSQYRETKSTYQDHVNNCEKCG